MAPWGHCGSDTTNTKQLLLVLGRPTANVTRVMRTSLVPTYDARALARGKDAHAYSSLFMCSGVTEVGCLWGGTRLVMVYLLNVVLCRMCVITSRCNLGAAAEAEADAIGEQQLKWTHSESSSLHIHINSS